MTYDEQIEDCYYIPIICNGDGCYNEIADYEGGICDSCAGVDC